MRTGLIFEPVDRAPKAAASGTDFEELADELRPRVFRFLLASVRDRETAENLTQECFLRAYRARDQFRGNCSYATWLLQIAINLVRKHESNGRLKFWRRALQPGLNAAELRDWVPDRGISQEEAVLARERVAAVWAAAGQLSERQRTVFLLRFVEDMEILEIARATGMKEGTVKTHLFRAVQAVRVRVGVAQ